MALCFSAPALLQSFDVGFQRGGVHRDQDVRVIARRQDVAAGELDLERADPVEGPGRGPDLRREVRQRGQVVAEDSGGAGEPVAGELHPIARITGEPDDDVLLLLHGLGHPMT